MADALDRLRAVCLALPEVYEAPSHGEPTFRVGKKQFAMFASAENHHGAGRNAVWVKSTHFTADQLIRADPSVFFTPPYVAHLGWVGVYLDDHAEWDMLAGLLHDAYRMVAPKRLLG